MMLCPPLTPAPVVQDWLERHRRPVTFALHMVGIPMTLMGVLTVPIYVALMSVPLFVFSATLFVVGYLIQFLGHALEGSEPGEVAYLRKKLTRSLKKRIKKAVAATSPAGQNPGPVA